MAKEGVVILTQLLNLPVLGVKWMRIGEKYAEPRC